jgi:hypothetical protein
MAVLAYSIWRVRPSGNNANGAGYDGTTYPGGTDYSQQSAAQATGTNGAGSASTTFTDATANAFTSQMVGNAINISGQGTYFVTTFTSSSQVVVDRALGTFSGASWKLGGAWADFWTNTTSSGPVVGGNTIYILGGASPSTGSPDYTASAFTPVTGTVSSGGGLVRFIADPNTPANNGFDGRVLISTAGALVSGTVGGLVFQNLWFFATAASVAGIITMTGGEPSYFINCVADQNGYDISLGNNPSLATGSQSGTGGAGKFILCEVFSSTAKRTTNAKFGIGSAHYGIEALYCNIHDCIGPGIAAYDAYCHVAWCISANNGGNGIAFSYTSTQTDVHHNGCEYCTIDGNGGDGINMDSASMLGLAHVYNCIISNHTGSGKYGFNVATGSATANEFLRTFTDYNSYYGNTNDLNNLNIGTHSTTGGSNPYAGQSTENYTLV